MKRWSSTGKAFARASGALGGDKTFTEDVGHFWVLRKHVQSTSAGAGFANCSREAGKLDDAIGHYQELLRLNPNYNLR